MEKKPAAAPDATKMALTASLKRLMAQKPLNKISIREITEGCGVNRQTFYYHFEDIYDQVKWMYQQEAISLLAQHEGVLVWQDGLLQLFRYLQNNRAVCLCTLKSMGRDHLKRFFLADIHAIIHRTIDSLFEGMPLSAEQQELSTHFYVVALAGMIESCLLGEIDRSPEELVSFADDMIQDQMAGARLRLGIA